MPTVRRLHAALALLSAVLPLQAHGAPTVYGVRLPRDGLVIEVPYTLGMHREHVTEVDGTLRIDRDDLRLEQSRLAFPLAGFRSDDPKRGCHLREALGLDYTRSRFPREHVCDDQNHMPAAGPDAIAYHVITLELTRGAPSAPRGGDSIQVEADGVLTVHGVSRPVRLRFTVSPDSSTPGVLRVRGRVPLRLSDFGVQVKPAKVLFASITVRDEVTADVDVLLEPLRRESQRRQPGPRRRSRDPRSRPAPVRGSVA